MKKIISIIALCVIASSVSFAAQVHTIEKNAALFDSVNWNIKIGGGNVTIQNYTLSPQNIAIHVDYDSPNSIFISGGDCDHAVVRANDTIICALRRYKDSISFATASSTLTASGSYQVQ